MLLGPSTTNKITAVVTRQPIDIKNDTVNLPASSWKSYGINLPYTGSVKVKISVVRGNPTDVLLMDATNMEKFKNEQNDVKVFLQAEKTTQYEESVRLSEGQYHLVLRDKTLGILSSSSSDIKVHVRFEP